jgi:hypothetical protein
VKLIIYTWKKEWTFDYKEYQWEIWENWVVVKKVGKDARVYYFPRERIMMMMVTKDEGEGK